VYKKFFHLEGSFFPYCHKLFNFAHLSVILDSCSGVTLDLAAIFQSAVGFPSFFFFGAISLVYVKWLHASRQKKGRGTRMYGYQSRSQEQNCLGTNNIQFGTFLQ
jgi:hypothetical protein